LFDKEQVAHGDFNQYKDDILQNLATYLFSVKRRLGWLTRHNFKCMNGKRECKGVEKSGTTEEDH